jgi:hypothetical protein
VAVTASLAADRFNPLAGAGRSLPSQGGVTTSGAESSAAATEFDDVTMWMDTDADGTIPCRPAALGRQRADDFNSATASLAYDDNGNLADDATARCPSSAA